MGKKLVSRAAKVLSETKKSKDKEAIAVAYEHIPRNPEEQRHGAIYAVIEIEDSGGHAEIIADSILDSLHNEYYMDTQRDSLSSFEAALAKVNEELAERSSEGQINWLGKLNAVLAVLSENTLHLSQAGKAETFLYRGDQAIHVTEGLSGDSINPLRTFINVASGDLTENDKIAFVTPGVFLKLSKNELKQYATESSPKIAVENLSKVLSGDNTKNLPNAVLILEMISPEAFANEPEPDVSTEAWVDPDNNRMEPITAGTIKGAAKVFDIISKAAAGASAIVATKIIPGVKSISTKTKEKIQGFKKDKGAENIILEDEKIDIEKDIKIPKDDASSLQNLETIDEDNIEQKDVPGVNEYRIREEEKPQRLSLERFDFSFATKAKDWTGKKFRSLKMPGGNKKLYFIIGIFACVAIIGLVVFNTNENKIRTETENKYAQAKSKYEEALSEIAAGRKTDASEDLDAADKLAKEVKTSKYRITEVDKLITDIDETRNQIEGIIKNTAQEFFDLGKGEVDAIYSDGKLLYVVKYSDASIFALDPKAKTLATLIDKANIDGKIKFSTYVSERNVVVAYTDSKEIYEFDLKNKKATKQSVGGMLEEGIAMSSFGTNIYILSPSDNELFKHVKISGGYGQKSAYFSASENPNASNATDLGIDSNIYVVTNPGIVEKYTSGKKQSFSISGLPASSNEASRLFANEGVEGLYLFSKNKIFKIDENQQFAAQYLSDSIKNIKSLLVLEDGTIFVLSEGKVFSVKS